MKKLLGFKRFKSVKTTFLEKKKFFYFSDRFCLNSLVIYNVKLTIPLCYRGYTRVTYVGLYQNTIPLKMNY